MRRGDDLEIVEALAVAGAREALLQPGPVFVERARHETERQPAVGDLARQAHGRLRPGAEIDRDVGVGMQDHPERLAHAGGAFALVGERDFPPVVGHRLIAREDLPHDRDIVLDAPVGPAPGLPVPALDDLRARNADADDHPPAARERVDGLGLHGGIGGCARGKLDDPGAKLDPLRDGGQIGERRHGVGAVRLGRPHRIVAEPVGELHQFGREIEHRARVTD